MLVALALACVLGVASPSPIVQSKILNDLVAQRSSVRERYTGQQIDILDSFTPVLPPITEGPLSSGNGQKVTVVQITEVPAPTISDGQQQAAAQSSSESESLNQSESEDASPETSEEPDSDTSEQTMESQDTSENMTSEEMENQMEMQFTEHTNSEGHLRDNSHGNEENIRRSWIHALSHRFHHRVHAEPITRSVASEVSVEAAKVGVAEAGTVGVATGGAPVMVAPTLPAAATGAVVPELESAASESIESAGDLEQWSRCSRTADNGDCTSCGITSTPGTLRREVHRGHLII